MSLRASKQVFVRPQSPGLTDDSNFGLSGFPKVTRVIADRGGSIPA